MIKQKQKQLRPPIDVQKIQAIFQQIDHLVTQLLQNLTQIYNENSLKHFNKPSHQSLMRLLTPYELKVFIDQSDICSLFEDKPHLISPATNKDKGYQKPASQFSFQDFFPPKIHNNIKTEQNQIQSGNKAKIQQAWNRQKKLKLEESIKKSEPQKPKTSFNVIGPFYNFGPFAKSKKQLAVEKISQWVRQQISMGKAVTRRDLKRKARQTGDSLKLKLNQRWFKGFMRNNMEIRRLLTHGNSNKAKKTDVGITDNNNQDVSASQDLLGEDSSSMRSEKEEVGQGQSDEVFLSASSRGKEWRLNGK